MFDKIGSKVFLSLQVVCIFLTHSIFAVDTYYEENSARPAKVASQVDELKNLNEAVMRARSAVEAFSDSSFLPELLFHLSELELIKAKLEYNVEMENYDHKLQLHDKDSINYPLPQEPILTYRPTLEINRRIINEFPDVSFLDKVMYRSGMCLYEIGARDSARTLFSRLVELKPDSSFTAELYFRIGECYFDEQKFDDALAAYDKILENWDSPFFVMALYKKAWCYYNLNDYPQAISTYFYLLKDIQWIQNIDVDILGKSQFELRNEAMEYIAICFMDFGGLDLAIRFINDLGGSEYAPQILQKMATLYFKRDFFDEAAKVDKALLKLYPLYEYAPQVHYHLFECYNKLSDPDNTLIVRNDFVKAFNSKSAWVKQYDGEEKRKEIIELVNTMDAIVATPYLNRADSLFTAENYDLASTKYKNFLKTFPNDERADHAAYFFAESFYELENYETAAIAYRFVTVHFPNSELREDAAYNRIVCYDNVLKNNAETKQDTLLWVQAKKQFQVPLQSESQKKVILACRDFVNWFPKSERSVEIQIKLIEIFMNVDQYKLAENLLNNVLLAIIKYKRGVQHYSKALSLMAQANFKQDDFRKAEKWYSLLIKQHPDSAELIAKSKTMLASASYKVAEAQKEKGNADAAALKFEKTAYEADDEKIAEAALFESALQFEKVGKLQRAAVNFETFCKRFPKSENLEAALYHAATIREKLAQWYLAAKNYIDIFHLDPHSSKGASALFNAGLNYENAKAWTSMIQTYIDFIDYFPNEQDKILEVMFKVGYAFEQIGNEFQASQMYQRIADKYNNLIAADKSADDFIAAEAQFRIGEIEHKKFSAIKLKPPFQQHLKTKQIAFNNMLQYLVEVAKYNVAEWTTAAFYTIGYAYEEFCQDILNSPAPTNLSTDQLQEYWDMIHQQWVLPLQAEALKYYKSNEKLAIENNIENNWIEKTKDRVLYLNKKLATFNGTNNETLKKTVNTANDEPLDTKKRNL